VSTTPARLRLADASVRVDPMPTAGRHIHVLPAGPEREALAAQLGVTSVDALDVTLHAVKFRGGMRVSGRLTAQVTQPSVVSLEPVVQHLAEPIDRIFLPSGEKDYAEAANAEILVDLEGDELPDHFEGTEADLTELIVETLALAVELYPRKPGESLDDVGLKPDLAHENPFAALKALKPNEG
jgi:uncharacterized metal-binding protein YceD (DUF177 family)